MAISNAAVEDDLISLGDLVKAIVKYKKLCLLIVALFCSIGVLYASKKNPQYEFTQSIVPAYLPDSVNGLDIQGDPHALQDKDALKQYISLTLNKLNGERRADGSGYPQVTLADGSVNHSLLTLSARSEKTKMTLVGNRMQKVLTALNAYQSPAIDLVRQQANIAIHTNQSLTENVLHAQKQLPRIADYSINQVVPSAHSLLKPVGMVDQVKTFKPDIVNLLKQYVDSSKAIHDLSMINKSFADNKELIALQKSSQVYRAMLSQVKPAEFLSPLQTSPEPVSLSRSLIIIVASFFGLMVAMIVALVLDYWRRDA